MREKIPFADLALARRLERAEGAACAQFAEARRKLFPESGSEWMECGGAYVVFDGVDSPVTQTFGLGVLEELSAVTLDRVEKFFQERGAQVMHEVSPLAGVATLDLLCARKYRPIEISSVLYRPVEKPFTSTQLGVATSQSNIKIRVTRSDESGLWSDVSARGWGHDHPEFIPFLRQFGVVAAARKESICFLGEVDGQVGAAAALSIHEGVALLGGSATVPELRRKGLHAALLEERMRYACDHGCDLALMVAMAGSDSQRNAERKGFRVAYTRMKWQLFSE